MIDQNALMTPMRQVLALIFVGVVSASPVQANPALSAHPLKPPDTSGPRNTMEAFITSLEDAYRIAGTPGASGSFEALARAVRCLDLSAVPPELRENTGIEAALLLKEVLDRLERLDQSAIPTAGPNAPESWAVPNTPIKIRRVADGPRAGEYLFTPETVARAREFYDRVRAYPYQDTATPGIYTAYLTTPGRGLELGWSDFFPDWSKGVLAGQTYWQWIALLLTALALVLAMAPAIWLARRPSPLAGDADRFQAAPLRPLLLIAVAFGTAAIVASEWFIDEVINITGGVLVFAVYALAVLRYTALTWLAGLLITLCAKLVIRARKLDPTAASARLIHLASWVIVGLVVVGILVAAGQDFGFPVYSIVTGLGVGGIAIGFGAQSLVRDVLSGVFFLIDDAFREGEYIQTGKAKGTVEKISVRSIQLRHHNGPLNTIPFSEIQQVTNLSRDWVIMKLPIRVPFGTDPDRVRRIIKKLGLELLEDPELGPQFLEPLKSQGVLQLDDFGIVIRVKYMTRPGDQFTLRKIVYARIQEAFEKEGIHFAGREVRIRMDDGDEPDHASQAPASAVALAAEIGDGEAATTDRR
ncbi:MAG: mechanosensitive ion channel family protein [Alphaproteobacteria bacterium]|nr:mechanosensitive ion channel family protein [Alphaproteobacteria bacterium]